MISLRSNPPAVARPYLSIVLPAYNEEARLPASLDRVIAFLAQQPFGSEIVIADDGSRDGTAAIVRGRTGAGLPPGVAVRLVQHATNQGKGAAIRTGILAAEGRYVFFLDADLATPPEDALKLLTELEEGAPVAIGSRLQPDGSDMRASQPAQRRMVGRLFTLMRKAMRVLPDIEDTQCPMKGFEREVARAVFQRQRLRGWIFDAEVLHIARQLGYRIVSVPVSWRHVDGSRLRVRPQQAYEVARDLVRLRLRRAAAPIVDGPAVAEDRGA
ncbi:MAG TPA: dolichyl-phosphate beta-glucosyltransferase [Dehalococcoidia bacterium]|nr:dolichyl-phosphate beta-glucosyltransferase [Dehalococcoidia bacterium]